MTLGIKVRWVLESACNSLADEPETLSFQLLGPEKNAFKDGKPTFKIMTIKGIFFEAISLGILIDVLRDGTPCTFEYPIQQVSNKTHYKIAKK